MQFEPETMNRASRPARSRSLLGLLLALLMLPMLLSVLACLPTPVGDPEKSRVDPKMIGAWFCAQDEDTIMMLLEGFDPRCYLATSMEPEFKPSEAGQKPERAVTLKDLGSTELLADNIMVNKSWLTTLGGKTFMCWEPKLMLDKTRGMRPEVWYVWKVEFDGKDELALTFINHSYEGFKGLKEDTVARNQVEAVIEKNVDDPKLYSERYLYRRIPQAHYDAIANMLSESRFESD